MAQKIIPIFVVYNGCPHRCIYCNERITAGNHPDRITKELFRTIVDRSLETAAGNSWRIQIAFYGGNFTGINRDYQRELLEMAAPYIENGPVDSVRVSTRPDYIDSNRVALLRQYHVSTVEIGVQSMVDDVLNLSKRGHSSDHVRNAVEILQESGFETGVHLMVGLPGDTEERFRYTVEAVIKLRPHMVRIHPTLVFRGTALAKSYEEGAYIPMEREDAINLCKFAVRKFEASRIPVIRLGLQTTREMERDGNIVAGPYHPAFRSLVESSIFFDMASHLLNVVRSPGDEVIFRLHPKDVSDFRGLKNQNIRLLKDRFALSKITVQTDHRVERGHLSISFGDRLYGTDKLLNEPQEIIDKRSGARV